MPRIAVADALRGMAVAGIIRIRSCEHFDLGRSGLGPERAVIEGRKEPVARFMRRLPAGKA